MGFRMDDYEASDDPALRNWYITFGVGSLLRNVIVCIRASSQQKAFEIAAAGFPGIWSHAYGKIPEGMAHLTVIHASEGVYLT